MFTVLTCIADQHDRRLLLVALVICVVSAATGLSIYARAVRRARRVRVAWSAFAGFVAGCGVWATHFVAMLAYQAQLPITYGFDLTAISLAAAVAILACGFFLAARSRRTPGRLAGGATVGGGVVAMHLVGVSAMSGPSIIAWNGGFFAAALVMAFAFAAAGVRRGGTRRAASPVLGRGRPAGAGHLRPAFHRHGGDHAGAERPGDDPGGGRRPTVHGARGRRRRRR